MLNNHKIHFNNDGLMELDEGRLYVPDHKDLRERLVQLRHDAPIGGHGGQRRTLENVSRDYYWIDMQEDISEYVRNCHACIVLKWTEDRRKVF